MRKFLQNIGYVAGLIVFAVVVVTIVRGPQGIHALTEKRKEIRALQEQNADLSSQNEQKRVRIQRLTDNTSEQELEIRDRLKLMRPGETSVILPEAPKAAN